MNTALLLAATAYLAAGTLLNQALYLHHDQLTRADALPACGFCRDTLRAFLDAEAHRQAAGVDPRTAQFSHFVLHTLIWPVGAPRRLRRLAHLKCAQTPVEKA